jgi:putative Mn2+ efflux pump MntP
MNLFELFLTAVGLSMDAFAVAICIGLSLGRFSWKKAVTVGLYFGIFQAGMPVLGYFAATFFAEYINAYSHWAAFGVLAILGGRMIKEAISDKQTDRAEAEVSLSAKVMLPFALATSIDAAAVGVTFALLQVDVVFAVAAIGAVTLIMSLLGVKIGNVFGARFKSRAEIAGGVILILIGTKLLLEALFWSN